MKYQLSIIIFLFIISNLYTQNTISVASEPDYPPFCIVNENGEADGFSVDLFKEAASSMGLKVEIKVDTWHKIKKELAEGRIDALPLVGRSPERDKIYDFTFPYHTLHGAVFVRKGTSGINILEDLKTKEILVMKGDNAEEYVFRSNISSQIISTENYQKAFKLLKSGEHDAVIAQRLMGLQLLNLLDIDTIIPLNIKLDGFFQDFSFAVKEGNRDLLAKLNEGLAIIIADGTYDELHKKWFTPEMQTPVPFKEILKTAIYILIPVIILIFFITILILRSQVNRKTKNLIQEIIERRKAEEEIKHQLSEKEIILKEVHHRIKNNFASIGSLLSLQAQSISNTEALSALQDAMGRVNSMSILYEKLLLTDNYSVTSIKEYLDNLINEIISIFPENTNVTIEKQITNFQLDPKRLIPIGIIVNEILTNTMKYAFTGKDSGLIQVTLEQRQEDIILIIQDNGNGLPKGFDVDTQKGFGLMLVNMLTQQLEGNFTIENNNGTKSTLEFNI